jgi:nitroreductase
MDINEAILTRRSIRKYKADPVPRKVLEEIIETARWAVSPMNMQPWEFAVLGGEKMKQYKDNLLANTRNNIPDGLDIPPRAPGETPEPYNSRGAELRATRENYHFPEGTPDLEKKKQEYTASTARAFDAPNAIIIYTERSMAGAGFNLASFGAVAQCICLAALKYKLGTCIMGRAVAWPKMIRELCNLPESKAMVCAIAIGYPEADARINNFPRTRANQEEFVTWHGF